MIGQMVERYNLLLTIEVRVFWLIAGNARPMPAATANNSSD